MACWCWHKYTENNVPILFLRQGRGKGKVKECGEGPWLKPKVCPGIRLCSTPVTVWLGHLCAQVCFRFLTFTAGLMMESMERAGTRLEEEGARMMSSTYCHHCIQTAEPLKSGHQTPVMCFLRGTTGCSIACQPRKSEGVANN